MIYQKPTRYINPLTDFGFKKLFFNEDNKELLVDFLNAILPRKDRIKTLEYRPTEILGEHEDDRKAVFDILCTNSKGEYFIVEMQQVGQQYFIDRSIFYAARVLVGQAKKGKWNYRLKGVYFIGILNFSLPHNNPESETPCVRSVHLAYEETNERFSDKMRFIFVELPTFTKGEAELKTDEDCWLYSLRNLPKLDSRPETITGAIFDKLYNEAELNQLTTTEMQTYNKSLLKSSEARSIANYAREESRKESLAEGKKIGEEIGVIKGEQKSKLQIALNCLKEGMSVEQIRRITGLDKKEILELQP